MKGRPEWEPDVQLEPDRCQLCIAVMFAFVKSPSSVSLLILHIINVAELNHVLYVTSKWLLYLNWIKQLLKWRFRD